MKITDEAVQVAKRELRYSTGDWEHDISRALAAAYPHLAPLGYEVKKLEWVKGDVDENYHFANTSIQNYIITIFPDETLNIRLLGTSQHGSWYNNIDEAKAAAQADFERRVREFIIAKSLDVAAVRRQALEEGFENGVEQSLNALNACDDITRNEAEQGIRKLKPDYRALSAEPVQGKRKYKIGDRLTKTKGSKWTGAVVGFYSTALTPVGYAIESETETGSVQIYPETALTTAPTSEAAE